MSKSEVRRLDKTDPIKTEAGLKLFTEMNNNFGSSVWSPVRIGIIAIEAEMREQISQEIEALKTADNFIYDVCANIARGTVADDATVEGSDKDE